MTHFTDFPVRPSTLTALAALKIDTPTPIQEAALPPLLEGRDLVGQARTGSGKTLAFAIPLVERIEPRERKVQALVLTPTRELATQVSAVIDTLGRERRLTTTLIYGGVGITPQEAALRRGAQVVVGTPGRVLDLLRRRTLTLDGVRFLVLDEADEMLDRGFAPDVERILAHTPKERQTALFSATVPPWVLETGAKHLRQPVTVRIDTRPEDRPKIEHIIYDVPTSEKLDVLKRLLDVQEEGATIVFGRTKHGVKKLGKQLTQLGYPVAVLQGNLSQNARDRVMADFRSGAASILLATNVAARGIDVATVERVINYDLPESSELLTHRVGRTGRMGRSGQALTLLTPDDAAKWRQLERGLGVALPRLAWRDEYAATPPDVAALAARPTQPARPRPSAPDRPVRQPAPAPRVSPPAAPTFRAAPAAAPVRHVVTCAACGQETTVPFVPRTDRPLYCRDCFQSHRPRPVERARQSGRGQAGARRDRSAGRLVGSAAD
ncbi:MAG: DEAD/DEAH box helicase [Thermomicrobiales bacterium]